MCMCVWEHGMWLTRSPGLPSLPSSPSMPGGPFQCRTDKQSADEDSEQHTEFIHVKRSNPGNKQWYKRMYHQSWRAWWARGSCWSLRPLWTIVTLWKWDISVQWIIYFWDANVKNTCLCVWYSLFHLWAPPCLPFHSCQRALVDPKKQTQSHRVPAHTSKGKYARENLKHVHTGDPGKPGCPWKPLK